MDYIVVQAGGKGTRLKHLTTNKPKALVPVDNLPMLFHLFRKFPDKRFVIIADYKKDVMREYLHAFADVQYQVVDAVGTGTCSGISQASSLLPDGKPFMLVWSDLVLPDGFAVPEEYEGDSPVNDYVGLSQTFPCRWKYEDGEFAEESSTEFGVAGLFFFKDKAELKGIPESGELVRWLSEQGREYGTIGIGGTKEFGLIEEYEKLEAAKCRPFNRVTVEGDRFIKEPIDDQGKKLAKREAAWYEKAKNLHIPVLPEIYDTNPLTMEYIKGKNIYDGEYEYNDKKRILTSLIEALHGLHQPEQVAADSFSMKEAYYDKTMDRLSKIEHLVPFAEDDVIIVNKKQCRNIFRHRRLLEKKLDDLTCKDFAFIHGDCTFSNMMIRESGEPVLIDPRGYFGFTELYGDVRYDWAKLYYSIVGNYDQFNLKRFRLEIGGEDGSTGTSLPYGEVRLEIESNGWEDMEKSFFELTKADPYEIKLLHAVIWLSLTTYAWQDYDSICGAFYNGLYYLEDVL